MKLFIEPDKTLWGELARRANAGAKDVSSLASGILEEIRLRGDSALADYTERFDGKVVPGFRCSIQARDKRASLVSQSLREAILVATDNISRFHESQLFRESRVETTPGVVCFRESRPLKRVGIYVPGGTAPLFSTLIMLAVPAKVAGVREIVLATPGDVEGEIHPAIAFCAQQLGIDEIYLMGGAQAIGALAYGTESVPRVEKICGPGNRFVTEAKMQVAASGVAVDMPAGPSEVLVVADKGAPARYIAADLLAQAEHGTDSDVVLVSDDEALVERVNRELSAQLTDLPRAAIAQEVIRRARAVVFKSLDTAIEFSNYYAPEHLILSVQNGERYVPAIQNAGSVFIGYLAPESFGDYASGTNHVLPTNGFARALSGVSVDTFVKKITFQSVTRDGLRRLGATVIEMARAEGLEAHARAIIYRQEGEYA